MRIIKVIWEDTQSNDDGDLSASGARNFNPCHCETVGFLITESKKKIVIAGSTFPHDKEYRNVLAIPKGCVLEVKELKEATDGHKNRGANN